jgi:hypothetical protein
MSTHNGITADIAGRIDIGLQPDSVNGGLSVALRSSRPFALPNLFIGRRIDEVLTMIDRLYSVCASAQSVAAVTAAERAFGLSPASESVVARTRQLLCELEIVKEHIWRLTLDWSTQFVGAPQVQLASDSHCLLQRLHKTLHGPAALHIGARPTPPNPVEVAALAGQLRRILEHRLFDETLDDWLQHTDSIDDWLHRSDAIVARLLRAIIACGYAELGAIALPAVPRVSETEWLKHLEQDAGFAERPVWHGTPRETTAYSRRRDHPLLRALTRRFGEGLLVRLTARLVELALLSRGWENALDDRHRAEVESSVATRASGTGMAQVETARGTLIHRLNQRDGKIERYSIVAPTEWNFHPAGIAVQVLRTLPADDPGQLRQQADWLVRLFDPCVAHTLKVYEHA